MNQQSFRKHNKGGKGKIELERWRNGRPEREATESIIIPLTSADKKKGVPKSFTHCAGAIAARRQGYTDVFFLRSIAYIGVIKNGYSAIERFEYSTGTKEFVKKYDRGESVTEITQMTLLPVPPSRTKEAHRAASAKRAKRIKAAGGKVHTKLTTKKERRPLAPNDFEFVRDGRGFRSSSHGAAHP